MTAIFSGLEGPLAMQETGATGKSAPRAVTTNEFSVFAQLTQGRR